jgi:hypothetical protein
MLDWLEEKLAGDFSKVSRSLLTTRLLRRMGNLRVISSSLSPLREVPQLLDSGRERVDGDRDELVVALKDLRWLMNVLPLVVVWALLVGLLAPLRLQVVDVTEFAIHFSHFGRPRVWALAWRFE